MGSAAREGASVNGPSWWWVVAIAAPLVILDVVVIWAIAKFDGWRGPVNAQLGSVEGSLGSVQGSLGSVERRLGSVEGRLGSVDGRLGSLETLMEEIRADIRKILERLGPSSLVAGGPRALSDFGRKVAEKVRAEDWAASIAPSFLSAVRGKQPYQVDRFSYEYAHSKAFEEMDADGQSRIDSCAYELGIERDGVLDVLYIALRDALLRDAGAGAD